MVELACPSDISDPFRCRTKEEYLIQLMSMLPRGRAWQSHEAITSAIIDRYPSVAAECGEAQCGDAECGQIGMEVERTVLASYWAVFAEMEEYFSQRVCQLLDEFFCKTVNEMADVWAEDYGFPDPCEPWTTLCEKVAALGGATCEYLRWVASTRGWEIDCLDCGDMQVPLGIMAGCFRAGLHATPCADCDANVLWIYINVVNSPAWTQSTTRPARAGCMMAGCTVLCAPSPQSIECIIERFKPAHVEARYVYNYTHDFRAIGLTTSSPYFGNPSPWTVQAFDLRVDGPTLEQPTLTEI